MKSISDQLHKVIDELEEEINRDRKATLIFKIENWKFDKFIKSYTKDKNEIGIEITN